MTSDLERDLQRALREGVDHVTPDRLRHDRPNPTPARRPRWAVAGPILAAACVAVLALAVTLVATNRHGATRTAGGRTGTLVGTSWTLRVVSHAGTTVQIPPRVNAGVEFARHGVLDARDGLNTHQGTYALHDAQTMGVRAGPVSAIGYAGHDRATLAAINGISAIFGTGSGRDRPNAVTVRLHAGALTLVASGYTLTFASA